MHIILSREAALYDYTISKTSSGRLHIEEFRNYGIAGRGGPEPRPMLPGHARKTIRVTIFPEQEESFLVELVADLAIVELNNITQPRVPNQFAIRCSVSNIIARLFPLTASSIYPSLLSKQNFTNATPDRSSRHSISLARDTPTVIS